MPYVLAAENDLLIAKALIRSGGDMTRAATLINRTRVTRGGLAAASASDGAATLLGYISYERDVELLNTNGLALFDRRRTDELQTLTPRHLPVPAAELNAPGLPVYTFGGTSPDR